jgi:hypothetical protein
MHADRPAARRDAWERLVQIERRERERDLARGAE